MILWIKVLGPITSLLPLIDRVLEVIFIDYVVLFQRGDKGFGKVRLFIEGFTGHIEPLDEATDVFGHESLSEHFPHGLFLVAHRATPFVATLLLLLHLNTIVNRISQLQKER